METTIDPKRRTAIDEVVFPPSAASLAVQWFQVLGGAVTWDHPVVLQDLEKDNILGRLTLFFDNSPAFKLGNLLTSAKSWRRY